MNEEIRDIENRRTRIGVSQSELCRRADLHATTLYKLLKGTSIAPHRRTIAKLKRALTAFEEEAA